jgi:ATP-dependent exoDNAse (exonuclease V) beta subunit
MDIFNIEQRFNEDLEQDRVFLKEFLELTLLIESQRTIFLEDFIEKIEQEGLNIQIGLPEGINAIRVITIHKAKGLEFPYVFIPYTNWSVNTYPKPCVENQELIYLTEAADYLSEEVKYKRQRQIAEEAQELLNLFYVAATRAKKGLYCYLLETKKTNRSISVWIEELIKKSSLSDYVINLE